jgi:hypothetical protein
MDIERPKTSGSNAFVLQFDAGIDLAIVVYMQTIKKSQTIRIIMKPIGGYFAETTYLL